MRLVVVGLLPTLWAAAANAETPGIFLECTGHNLLTNFQTEHEVAVLKRTAEFDGKPYRLSESQTEFTLTGPAPADDTVVYINRLTGEFAITPAALSGNPKKLEESGKGEGCQKTSQKF